MLSSDGCACGCARDGGLEMDIRRATPAGGLEPESSWMSGTEAIRCHLAVEEEVAINKDGTTTRSRPRRPLRTCPPPPSSAVSGRRRRGVDNYARPCPRPRDRRRNECFHCGHILLSPDVDIGGSGRDAIDIPGIRENYMMGNRLMQSSPNDHCDRSRGVSNATRDNAGRPNLPSALENSNPGDRSRGVSNATRDDAGRFHLPSALENSHPACNYVEAWPVPPDAGRLNLLSALENSHPACNHGEAWPVPPEPTHATRRRLCIWDRVPLPLLLPFAMVHLSMVWIWHKVEIVLQKIIDRRRGMLSPKAASTLTALCCHGIAGRKIFRAPREQYPGREGMHLKNPKRLGRRGERQGVGAAILRAKSLGIACFALLLPVSSAGETLDCYPCVDRPAYTVRAIVHGSSSDIFWQQIRAAAMQSARDMGVNLQMDLYDEFDALRMASDIRRAADGHAAMVAAAGRAGGDAAGGVASDPADDDPKNRPPHALVVTIPDPYVEYAVFTAIESGMPVFGLNSGYEVAASLGMKGFVAMDEYVGGEEAAREFLKLNPELTRALFVNQEKGNSALDARRAGFMQAMQDHSNGNNSSATILVEELVVTIDDKEGAIEEALRGCPYDAVLLGNAMTLEQATSAFYVNSCPLNPESTMLATFDTGSSVFNAIAGGKLSFAVSQQQHLQGALSVMMAALHATTGKKLAPSGTSDFGVYFSGPKLIALPNLPSDTHQLCEADAFPVCPNDMAPDGVHPSRCECADRAKIKIGGVLHGVTTDGFWDPVFAGSYQAADDLGVELKLDRFGPEDDLDVLHAKMANKMLSLCQEGVNGLFVTIPSDSVISAIRSCQELNVPVLSINSGAEAAESLGLVHHIAQLEYRAGYNAGERLIDSGMERGYCVNHYMGNPAMNERCQGFKDAVRDSGKEGVEFLGELSVPHDNVVQFSKILEDAIGATGDWTGIGLLLFGSTLVEGAISLHAAHPGVIIGSFDTSSKIYEAIDEGVIVFGVDQEPYLQGYMPIPLLTWLTHTKQALTNTFVETGPSFVESPPSTAQTVCESRLFEVCPEPEHSDWNQITAVRPVGLALCGIVLLSSVGFLCWVILHRKRRVVRSSQPIFLIMICIGTFVMGLAIVPLSVDDGIASNDWCSVSCNVAPWLFTIGFTLAFSALFSKIWRINRIFASANKFRKVKVTVKDVMLPFFILLGLNVIVLLMWSLMGPMYWTRVPLFGSEDLKSSYGYCALGGGKISTALLVSALAINVCAVILANIQAYKARKISTEFNESRYVAMIMMSMLQIMVVGVPLIALVRENPSAKFFVMTVIVFVLSMSVLLLIFVPKMLILRSYTRDHRRSMAEDASDYGTGSPAVPSTGIRIINRQHGAGTDSYISSRTIDSLTVHLEDQGIESEPLFKAFKEVGIALGTSPRNPRSSMDYSSAAESLQGRVDKEVVFIEESCQEDTDVQTGSTLDPLEDGGKE